MNHMIWFLNQIVVPEGVLKKSRDDFSLLLTVGKKLIILHEKWFVSAPNLCNYFVRKYLKIAQNAVNSIKQISSGRF